MPRGHPKTCGHGVASLPPLLCLEIAFIRPSPSRSITRRLGYSALRRRPGDGGHSFLCRTLTQSILTRVPCRSPPLEHEPIRIHCFDRSTSCLPSCSPP